MKSQMQLKKNEFEDFENTQIFDKDPSACVFYQSSLPEISDDDSSENWTISGIQSNYNEHKKTKDGDVTMFEKGKFNDVEVMILDQGKNDYGEVKILEQSSSFKEITLCTTNEKCIKETRCPIVVMSNEVLTEEQISVAKGPCSLEGIVYSHDEEQTKSVKLETSRSITENLCDIVNDAKEVHSESPAIGQEDDEQVKCLTSKDVLMERDVPVLQCHHLKDAQNYKESIEDLVTFKDLSNDVTSKNSKNVELTEKISAKENGDFNKLLGLNGISIRPDNKSTFNWNKKIKDKVDEPSALLKIYRCRPMPIQDSIHDNGHETKQSSLLVQKQDINSIIKNDVPCYKNISAVGQFNNSINQTNKRVGQNFSMPQDSHSTNQNCDPFIQNISLLNKSSRQMEQSNCSVQNFKSTMQSGDSYNKNKSTAKQFKKSHKQVNNASKQTGFSIPQDRQTIIQYCNPNSHSTNQNCDPFIKKNKSLLNKSSRHMEQSNCLVQNFEATIQSGDSYNQSNSTAKQFNKSHKQVNNAAEQTCFSVPQNYHPTIQDCNPNKQNSSLLDQRCHQVEPSNLTVQQDINSVIQSDVPCNQNINAVRRINNSLNQTNNTVEQIFSMTGNCHSTNQNCDPFIQNNSLLNQSSHQMEQNNCLVQNFKSTIQSGDSYIQSNSTAKQFNKSHKQFNNAAEQTCFSVPQNYHPTIQDCNPNKQNSSSLDQRCHQVEPSNLSVQQDINSVIQSDGSGNRNINAVRRINNSQNQTNNPVEQIFSMSGVCHSTNQNCDSFNQKSSLFNQNSNQMKQSHFSVQDLNNATQSANPIPQSINTAKRFQNSPKPSINTIEPSRFIVLQDINSATERCDHNSYNQSNSIVKPLCKSLNQNRNTVEQNSLSVPQDNYPPMQNKVPNLQNCNAVKRSKNSRNQICNKKKQCRFLVHQRSITTNCSASDQLPQPIIDTRQSSTMHNQVRTHLTTRPNYSGIEKEKNFQENSKQRLHNKDSHVSFRQQMEHKPIDDSNNNINEKHLISSIDLEISECVKNWRRKYTWLLYENGIFTCANCRSSPPIYQIEKIDQKFCVSGKLCAHNSSITHNASFLRHNKNILLLIVKFLKSPLLQYDSKEILYAALVKFLNNNEIFTITEQSLPALIEAAAFLLEECEFAKYKVRAINGISFIIDQCRRILVIRSFNTAGQIVESLVPKFLNNESSFDDILSKFSENVVHCKYVYCENCDICVKHSNTLPGIDNLNAVPLRYSSIQSLIEVLQMDPSVQNYVICLRSIRNLTATNFNHWTDMKNFILLKSFNLQLLNKFLYIDTIIKLVEWVKVVKEQRFVSNTNLISVNILLPRLKNILSAWTIKYIDFLLHELEYKFYSVGLSQTELFECLYDLQFRANISQNNSALQVLTQIFSLFNQNNVPVESPSFMINYLAEFGNFIHNQMPSLEYSILNYLAKFQEDEILRNRFGVVHKFYKMFSLLPCFGASKIISLNDIAFIFSALVERFDRPFAIQIMQIRNTVLKAP